MMLSKVWLCLSLKWNGALGSCTCQWEIKLEIHNVCIWSALMTSHFLLQISEERRAE